MVIPGINEGDGPVEIKLPLRVCDAPWIVVDADGIRVADFMQTTNVHEAEAYARWFVELANERGREE